MVKRTILIIPPNYQQESNGIDSYNSLNKTCYFLLFVINNWFSYFIAYSEGKVSNSDIKPNIYQDIDKKNYNQSLCWGIILKRLVSVIYINF